MNDVLSGPLPCLRHVGASFWSSPGSPMQHLLGLRERLLGEVTAGGVRIALLHRAQWLLHWIEGPSAAVEPAWEQIQQLPELEAARVLHRSVGAEVLPEPVHVAAVFRREAPHQVASRITSLAERQADGDPMRLWCEMAAPAAIPPCGSVVLASAQVHDGIDLLRHVAQGQGIDVVYQRFADSDLSQVDSGSAFADFATADASRRTIRMQVLSRRGLGHPLVSGCLTAVREVVLLPGSHEGRATRLAESVLPLLKQRGSKLRVRIVGSEHGTLATAANLLRDAGAGDSVVSCFTRTVHEEASLLEQVLVDAEHGAEACHAREHATAA